jgi:hypothetical protein
VQQTAQASKDGEEGSYLLPGDYDPSGLEIQKDLERRMKNWGLTNFEIRYMLWHG